MTDVPPPAPPPTPSSRRRDPGEIRKRIEKVETLLERIVVVPVINQPVGLDAVLSLVPGVGTVSAAALGSYIAWEARNLGVSKWAMARMSGNILFDMALGAIPFVGAVPDFFFRSNTRNMAIIRRHLDRHHPETKRS